MKSTKVAIGENFSIYGTCIQTSLGTRPSKNDFSRVWLRDYMQTPLAFNTLMRGSLRLAPNIRDRVREGKWLAICLQVRGGGSSSRVVRLLIQRPCSCWPFPAQRKRNLPGSRSQHKMCSQYTFITLVRLRECCMHNTDYRICSIKRRSRLVAALELLPHLRTC